MAHRLPLFAPFISSALTGVYSGNRIIVKRALSGLKPPPYRIRGELISAIVPTHNEENFIGNCLTCIRNQTYFPIEMLIMDYASEDKTCEVARGYGAKVVKIGEPGVGNARDLGVLAAKSDFLFFTDADTIFENQLVEKMARDLESGWDLVTVPAVYYDTSNPLLILGINFSRFRSPWVLSARATLTHRDVWREVGGWELPLWEERHFGRKLREAGYKIKKRRDLAVATSCRSWYGQSRALRLRNEIIFPEHGIENLK